MRLIKLKPNDGWVGAFIWHIGILLLGCSLYFMWYNNISTAAFVQLIYDGRVSLTTTWFGLPVLAVIKEGDLPGNFGNVVGVVFSAIQVLFFLADDNDLKEQATVVKNVARFTFAADIFTSFFALMGGINVVDMLFNNPTGFFIRLAVSAFLALTFLSIGSEVIFALAVESLRVYYKPGLKMYGQIFRAVQSAINDGFESFEGGMKDATKPLKRDERPQTMGRRDELERSFGSAGGGGEKPKQNFGQPPQREFDKR